MPNTFKVYFAAWGDWSNPDVLTATIGREPDQFHAKGTTPHRTSVPRKRSVWRIMSGLEDTASLEEQLDAVLETLERYSAGVRRVIADHDAGINCAAYWHSSQPGFHLSERTLARVAALGLSLDFDMYCLVEDGETGG